MVLHFRRKISKEHGDCFNVKIITELNTENLEKLECLLSETFNKEDFSKKSSF